MNNFRDLYLLSYVRVLIRARFTGHTTLPRRCCSRFYNQSTFNAFEAFDEAVSHLVGCCTILVESLQSEWLGV